METKPKRRRFRYSLRTLLLLVAVASVGFGWLGYKVRQAQRQKEACEVIRKLGGEVKYDYEVDSDGMLIDSPAPSGPTWYRRLLGDDFFANVKIAFIRSPYTTDDDLEYYLHGLTKLIALNLNHTGITDKALMSIQRRSELKGLHLHGTRITDAGLVYLRGLTQLEVLVLSGTQVTDDGLAHLQSLTRLEILELDETHVTDKGCQELQKVLPKLEIVR